MPEATTASTAPVEPDESALDYKDTFFHTERVYWNNLYSGMDGLDSRVGPKQAAALQNLDKVSPDKEEARARMVNQSFLARQMPTLDKGTITGSWDNVKTTYAKERLGVDKSEISDKELYGMIGGAMGADKPDATHENAWGQFWHIASHPSTVGTLLAGVHALGSTPLIHLPEAPKNLPDIPSSGALNPALIGHVWNIAKPSIESMTSGENIALLHASPALGVIAEGSAAGRAAITTLGGVFSALMGYAAAKQTPEMAKTLQDPNKSLDEKGRAVMDVVTPAAMSLAGALGTFAEIAPKFAKEITHVADAPKAILEAAKEAKTPEEKVELDSAAKQVSEIVGSPEHETPQPKPPEETPPADPVVEKVPEAKTEPATPESNLVGIKNEAVDEEMKKMGLEDAAHGPGLSWEEAIADAKAKLAADPLAGQKLVQSLGANPRPITGQDDALLLSEVNRLRLERDSAEDAMVKAKQANDPAAIAEADARIAGARDAFAEAERVATQVGTPQAQGLALRRMMMREDYSLASLERQLAAETKDGKLTPEQAGEVKQHARDIKQTGEDLAKHEAARLKALKTRLKNATEEYERRVKKGDLKAKPPKPKVELDKEGEMLKAAHERAKQDFRRAVMEERMKNRSFYERGANMLLKWRRGFLLSSPVTLAKLSAAAAWRMVSTVAEEAVGSALSKLPGVSKVAAKAQRYGPMNSQAEAKALTSAFTQGMRDAWNTLRRGASDLDVIYGKGKDAAVAESNLANRSVMDFFGRLHGAIKAPVKRAEFTRSFEKRAAAAIRAGTDVTNPMVQTRIAVEAYKDANRAIFLQDNVVTDAYKRGMSAFEDGKYPAGRLIATAIRADLPIVKVPTNIVAETFESATGLATGSFRLAKALRAGVEKLPPEQADLIMRNLQKGSLGGAALLLGYFGYENIGGQYQRGEQRPANEPQAGEVQIGDVGVPSYLLHHPILEAVQLGATIHRVQDSKLRKRDQETQGLPEGVWAGALGLMEEVPFAQAMVQNAQFFDPRETQYATGEFLKSMLVPGGAQYVARTMDKDAKGNPIQRKVETIPEHIQSGIPGLREELPKRNPRTTLRP